MRKADCNKRDIKYEMQSESTEQGALWCNSGIEKLVFTENCRQCYGNGLLVAFLADCKQDLGKAYSLW